MCCDDEGDIHLEKIKKLLTDICYKDRSRWWGGGRLTENVVKIAIQHIEREREENMSYEPFARARKEMCADTREAVRRRTPQQRRMLDYCDIEKEG